MDINEIIHENRNKIRFRMTIVNMIYFLLFLTVNLFLFSTSDYLFSLLRFNSMPDQIKSMMLTISFGSLLLVSIRIDLMKDGIKSKLSSLKIFYYPIHNLQSKHKLTSANSNRLAILSRIIQMIVLDVGMPTVIILIITMICLIAILTRKLVWILQTIVCTPAIINGITFSCWLYIVFVIFLYYKFRFDQINHRIKSLIPNGKVIGKRRQRYLIKLINQQNLASIKIYKINLMIRRTAAAIFTYSITKANMIYLLIKFNNVLVKIIMFNAFISLALFSFVLSYLFMKQIKSAHQSYKLIDSVICTFKMNLRFKLKVKIFVLIFFLINFLPKLFSY